MVEVWVEEGAFLQKTHWMFFAISVFAYRYTDIQLPKGLTKWDHSTSVKEEYMYGISSNLTVSLSTVRLRLGRGTSALLAEGHRLNT